MMDLIYDDVFLDFQQVYQNWVAEILIINRWQSFLYLFAVIL